MKGSSVLSSTRPRFEILDGMRGVAAIIVVIFHIFEIHSKGPALQIINHGYLAVDFFFALSGFVIGYAYDDRWKKGMTLSTFFKTRVIRLQPMMILGVTLGALTYYFGLAQIESTTVKTLLLIWLLSCLLIPVTRQMDIRGWGEGYALDGPQWTLAFEYIANILYAVFIRHFSKKMLFLFVILSALLSIDLSLHLDMFGFLSNRIDERYTMIGGWSLDPSQLYVGFTRLLYPFFTGLLIYRLGLRIKIKGAFLVCASILCLALMMPRVGIGAYEWTNGLYEAFCVLIVFPLILIIGSGILELDARKTKICNWLGRISYPLYITHYSFIYFLFEWTYKHPDMPISVQIFNGIAVFLISMGVAYASERLYDIKIREWLKNKFLYKKEPKLPKLEITNLSPE
ncbi:MAG: acyltransferase [Muribaculaceae bacterium]|nr:acyltransferase [Muribaculaceae bacterium]